MPYSAEIRDKAKELREGGMSYSKIAAQLGVGRSTIRRWVTPGEMEKAAVYAKLYNETHPDVRKKYKEANKDKIAAKERDRYIKDRERILAVGADYRANNPEKRRETCKRYRDSHKEDIKIQDLVYRQNNHDEIIERGRIYRENNKEKESLRHSIYYENNREKISAKGVLYRENNKEKERERGRIYRENNSDHISNHYKDNRDAILAQHKVYRESHKEEHNEDCRRRKALMQAVDKIDKDQYADIFDEQDGLCFYCDEQMLRDGNQYHDRYYNVDHLNPIANGGFHQLSNVLYACRKCNGSKSDILVEEWMPSIMDKIYSHPRLKYDIEDNNKRWLI